VPDLMAALEASLAAMGDSDGKAKRSKSGGGAREKAKSKS
jgi:hypothetical protein